MIPCFHAVCRFSFFFFSVVHFSFFFLCAPACCGEFVRVYSGATKKKKGFYSKECLSLFFFSLSALLQFSKKSSFVVIVMACFRIVGGEIFFFFARLYICLHCVHRVKRTVLCSSSSKLSKQMSEFCDCRSGIENNTQKKKTTALHTEAKSECGTTLRDKRSKGIKSV